jgi:hypothetical protein
MLADGRGSVEFSDAVPYCPGIGKDGQQLKALQFVMSDCNILF